MRTPFLLSLFFSFLVAHGQSPRIEEARKLYEIRRLPEASVILKKVGERDKDFASAQYWLGRIAFDEKRYEDAADLFEEAVDKDPTVADHYSWLGNAYGNIAQEANVIRQGMLAPKMKSAWEKAIALDAQNINARISLIQFYTQAPGFMGGSFEKAYQMADQIGKINSPQGHLQRGNILLIEKKPEEAEKEFLEMVKADSQYTGNLANFYIGQKKYDKAFALLDDLLKKNPDDYRLMYLIGRTCAVSGLQLDRGETLLKKYLAYTPKANEPSIAGANMRLGQIAEKKGNKTEAKKHFEMALALDATLKEAKEGLQRTAK
jgi:tetratricopeptide (TPR) repeat protein